MKKLNFWLLASLFAGALSFTACSSSDGDGGGDNPGGQPPVAVNPSDMQMAKLSGFVTSGNFPLQGVTVTSGSAVATTDDNGAFTLSSVNVVNGRAVVKFSKQYYAEVVRSVEFREGDVWDVTMTWISSHSIDPATDNTINVNYNTNTRVEIPADALVAADGSAVTGSVKAEVAYLDPNTDDFSSRMPGGDLVALRTDNSEAQLVSYGMMSISMTDAAGKEVQVKEGSEVTLVFPAPEGLEAHDEIPLWSFNETIGIWEEEGKATKQADGTYKGTIKHFSWHNLDYPESRASVSLTVKDQAGNALPFQKVIVGQVYATTDANGKFTCNVPTNTEFDIVVRSVDYANYSPEVKETVNITTAGEVRNVTLTLPTAAHLSGLITNRGAGAQASVSLAYGGGETRPVMTDVNGKYYINLPVGYTGAATLHILAADGTSFSKNITLTGGDLVENYAIDTPDVATGTLNFRSNDGAKTATITVSDVSAFNLGGLLIYGDYIMTLGEGENLTLSVTGNKGYINYYSYDESAADSRYSYKSIYSNNADVTYTSDGSKYTFTVSGTATYNEGSTSYEGTFSGSFPYSILGTVTRTDASTSPASWVPTLSGKSPKWGYTLSDNAKLGTSWVLFYASGETIDDYNALVNTAKAALGEPYFVSDDADDEWQKSCTFINGNRILQINYAKMDYDFSDDPTWEPGPANLVGMHASHHSMAPITIRAYSNVTIPFTEMVMTYR